MPYVQDVEGFLAKFQLGDTDHPKVVPKYDESMGYDLSAAFARYVLSPEGSGIPLFIVLDSSVGCRAGFSIPSEFLLSVFELDKLSVRVSQLRKMHPNGITADDLRAFCVGAFRRFLYLDDDNHGRDEMDLTELTSGQYLVDGSYARQQWTDVDRGWPAKYIQRLQPASPADGSPILPLYKHLFPREINEVIAKMADLSTAIQLGDRANTASREEATK